MSLKKVYNTSARQHCKITIKVRYNMKKSVNLSLDHRIINLLSVLAAKYHLPKTKIMEEAIEMFAEKKSEHESGISSFAGSLKEEEGLGILESIQRDRRNKDVELGQ
jgi:predicted transcriptional regulator